jgi:hypothetical protein
MRALPNFRKPFVAAGGETMKPLDILCRVVAVSIWLLILAIYLVSIPIAIIATIVAFPIWFIAEKLQGQK